MQKRPTIGSWLVYQCKKKKKQKKEVIVKVINYQQFLDSIRNVEYPEVCLERDQRAAWKEMCSLSLVEANDRDLVNPFIELAAGN